MAFQPPPAGAKTVSPGGYDVGTTTVYSIQGPLKPPELAALTCSKCQLILREPMQVIACGHRYCKQCIEQLTNGSDGPYSCCVDQEQFELNEVRNDKGCLRDLQTLEVDCPTQPDPCTWRGKLVEMEIHMEVCPNKKFPCPLGCGEYFQKEDLETHMSSNCPKRPSTCQYCKKDFPFDSIQDHHGVCEEHPVSCDYCTKKLPSRKDLAVHLDQECNEYYMTCPLNECPFKGRKSDMIQHILTAHFIQHAEKMVRMQDKMKEMEKEMKGAQEEMKSMKSQNQKLQSEVIDLQGTISGLVKSSGEKDEKISQLKGRVEELEKERDEKDLQKVLVRDGVDTVERDGVVVKPRPSTLVDKNWSDVEKDCGVKDPSMLRAGNMTGKFQLGTLEPQAAHYVDIPFKPERAELSQVKQDVEKNHTQLVKMNESIHSMQESMTRYAIAIDEVRLRQDVLDVKTTHGILVWKIPDIRRRYRDAVERRTISLYSPPFYTSPHGYRMCIRTYLNGDGIGKGTHVSLFFVLMRSEHDNLLSWPFKQSVRFTLINQKNPAASITEAFVPDLHSPSFKKPENDMNIASGFPKFARQSVLQDENFTQGNVIYIKCQVDLSGLPYL